MTSRMTHECFLKLMPLYRTISPFQKYNNILENAGIQYGPTINVFWRWHDAYSQRNQVQHWNTHSPLSYITQYSAAVKLCKDVVHIPTEIKRGNILHQLFSSAHYQSPTVQMSTPSSRRGVNIALTHLVKVLWAKERSNRNTRYL